jgi:hypothetical protein
MKEQLYTIHCMDENQARTFLSPHWFAATARPGEKPNEIIMPLDEKQSAGFERDFPGTTITPLPSIS